MGWVLSKEEGIYYLKDEKGITFACCHWAIYGRKLSVENCNDIFGIVNVEKLAEYEYPTINMGVNATTDIHIICQEPFINGFKKAMDLNKDKLFTLEDMKKAYLGSNKYEWFGDLIKSISQPTEIEVEVATDICGDKVYEVPEYVLDEKGCLILTKK